MLLKCGDTRNNTFCSGLSLPFDLSCFAVDREHFFVCPPHCLERHPPPPGLSPVLLALSSSSLSLLPVIAWQLMSTGTVRTSQDVVGAPKRHDTLDTAWLTSWTRAFNHSMKDCLDDMKPVELMTLNQVLRAGVREDGQVRLCQSYLLQD